jgi:hypothetical protein
MSIVGTPHFSMSLTTWAVPSSGVQPFAGS